MTVKTKLDFESEDIKAINLTCQKCRQVTAWSPVGEGRKIPEQCPWCRTLWINGTGIKRRHLEDLFDFIVQEAAEKDAIDRGNGRSSFAVSFEVETLTKGEKP